MQVYLHSGINDATKSHARDILDRDPNKPLVKVMFPQALHNALVTGGALQLSRSNLGFNGTPDIHSEPDTKTVRAIVSTHNSISVYHQTHSGLGTNLYLNGHPAQNQNMQMSNYADVLPRLADQGASIYLLEMRDLLGHFLSSTIHRLHTLPAMADIELPGFEFSSIKRPMNPNFTRTQHTAIANPTNLYYMGSNSHQGLNQFFVAPTPLSQA